MTLNEKIKEQKKLVVTKEAVEAERIIAKNECEQEKTKLASLERSLIEETQAIEEGLKQNMEPKFKTQNTMEKNPYLLYTKQELGLKCELGKNKFNRVLCASLRHSRLYDFDA